MPAYASILRFPPMIHEYGERRWNDVDRGKPKNSEKNLPSASLSTTNSIWIGLGANKGLRGERPANQFLCLKFSTDKFQDSINLH
jgi:hypothetical protein